MIARIIAWLGSIDVQPILNDPPRAVALGLWLMVAGLAGIALAVWLGEKVVSVLVVAWVRRMARKATRWTR